MTFLIEISEFFTQLANQLIALPYFHTFGLIILFLWGAIPSAVPFAEVITLPLYLSGQSPVVLVIVSTLGVTVGNYFLYLLGRGAYRAIKGKHKENAEAHHLLHKYRFPIYFAVPFLFVIGDLLVTIGGYERIGFKKILPFLLAGELIRQSLGIMAIMGLVKLPDFF